MLYRTEPQDREDMVLLWSMCPFASPEDAVEAFEAAYPHAPEDEHLIEYVSEIARRLQRVSGEVPATDGGSPPSAQGRPLARTR